MKKVLAVTVAVLFLGGALSYAQSFRDMFKSDSKGGIEFGIRAGLNVSDLPNKVTYGGTTVKEDLKAQAGFHVGGVVGIPITNGFYIQPGLMFSSKGARGVEEEDILGTTTKISASYFPVYMEVPVLASFRADIVQNVKLNLNVGPYFAVGLGGNVKSEYTFTMNGSEMSQTDKMPFFGTKKVTEEGAEIEKGLDAKRFDCGLSFGAGVTLFENYYVGLKYDLGLMNIAKNEMDNVKQVMRNGTFAITLGYNF